jgi:hypothetical protein
MTQDDQTTTISEGMTGYIQKNPYYSSISTEDLTIVEFVENNELKTYTMFNDHVVNGIQLYRYNVISINSLQNPLENLDFDFSDVFIEQISDNEFKVIC